MGTTRKHSAVSGLTIGRIIAWGGAVSSMGDRPRRAAVGCVWNDSRKVGPGDVFIALATEKDDGHRYVAAAFAQGALAAIVDRRKIADCGAVDRTRLIAVADPLRMIQRVAARYRRELGTLIIGVTGSSGKTTTRSFIAAVLGAVLPTGQTYTNWNNHIGVPLSLLRFSGAEWAGVIELGANHEGEIGVLSRIARPDIALITNIGYAHVGLFGSLAATTRAKFEIVDGLDRKKGFLLLNGDDQRLVNHNRTLGIKTVYFGNSPRCRVRPSQVSFDPQKGLSFVLDGSRFHLTVPGRHYLYSALPAIFLGRRCGVPEGKIRTVLEAQRPLEMRGSIERKKKITFMLDCYNANPSSMKNAVTTLVEMAPPYRRAAIVGDMLELGKYSKRLHADLGSLLAESGVRKVLAVGEYAAAVAEAARKASPAPRVEVVANATEAVGVARALFAAGDVVLVKGSRSMHLENIFAKV